MPVNINAKLIGKEQLKPDIFKFDLECPNIAQSARPGQFLEIRCSKTLDPLLRRPISIYNIDKESGIVTFIFRMQGKGTKLLSEIKVGEEIDVIGPLGYGTFAVKPYKNVAIIGGGIGTFPLHELAKNLIKDSNVTTYLGFKSKEFVVLEEEFKKVSTKLILTTDDGTYGEKGFAIDFLKADHAKNPFDMIFACGPLPMLRAIRQYAVENNIPCQVSLEERMGCGLGVCLGCAVKVATENEVTYKHVCKEGPVFNAKDVEI